MENTVAIPLFATAALTLARGTGAEEAIHTHWPPVRWITPGTANDADVKVKRVGVAIVLRQSRDHRASLPEQLKLFLLVTDHEIDPH